MLAVGLEPHCYSNNFYSYMNTSQIVPVYFELFQNNNRQTYFGFQRVKIDVLATSHHDSLDSTYSANKNLQL